jgi:hypothetical protein
MENFSRLPRLSTFSTILGKESGSCHVLEAALAENRGPRPSSGIEFAWKGLFLVGRITIFRPLGMPAERFA